MQKYLRNLINMKLLILKTKFFAPLVDEIKKAFEDFSKLLNSCIGNFIKL